MTIEFDKDEGEPLPPAAASYPEARLARFEKEAAAPDPAWAPPPARALPPADLAAGPAPVANVEAEAAVLGSCLLGSEQAIDRVLTALNTADFYKGAHGRVFDAIASLRADGASVDLISVNERLAVRGHLDFVGGPAAVAELTSRVASVSNVDAYVGIVREKAQLRRLEAACFQTIADIHQRQEQASMILDDAGERFLNVSEVRGSDFETLGVGWEQDFEALAASSRGEHPLGFPTGLNGIDRLTGGIMGGKTWVIGGRPGEGKTALCLNLAYNLANRNVPVAFFSLEMETKDLRGRIVSSVAEIDGNKIERGQLKPDELTLYRDTLTGLRNHPLYIFRDPEASLAKILALSRVAISKHRVKVIFLDYLQLLRDPDNRYGSLAQETTAICRRLSQFGRKHRVSIVEAAQLNRDIKDGDEPRVRHLKESGGIEENADVIALLYDKKDEKHIGQPVTPIELILGKHRGGDVGKLELSYTRRFLRFESLE